MNKDITRRLFPIPVTELRLNTNLVQNEGYPKNQQMMKTLFGAAILMVLPVLHKDLPEDLPINRIQVIGSHNSYKKAIDPALFRMFQARDSVNASKIDYEHIPLTEQLDMGLLNLEIDCYADERGGKYAHPKGLEIGRAHV